MGTSQHRMARHDQSRVACVGWRSSDLPTAIAPRHPIRVARLGSWHKARAKPSARVPKVARRRTRLRSWGAGRAVTSSKRRPDDLPRPRSSHLSQIARQISLVPMGAAHRTPITCHLHCFASSGHPVRVRLSAGWPEVEMAVMWAALPRSGTCGRLRDHKMGGSDASHLYLRSGAASGVTPLGLSATYTAQAAGRRTSTQHDAKKERMKETRLGKCGRGDSHAEGGGACTRPTKKNTTPARRRAPAALGCHDSRPRHAQCTSRNSALTPHVARVVAMDPCPRCAVGGRGAVLFLCGVEKRPSLMWRVVVVSGLCARRRAVQIWCGDGPCCGHFT